MNLENSRVRITFSRNGFELQDKKRGLSQAFSGCETEVGGKICRMLDCREVLKIRDLRNGGEEFRAVCASTLDGVWFDVYIHLWEETSFLRMRYQIRGDSGRLTKRQGKDHLSYLGLPLVECSNVTEIQISQYESVAHSYMPQEVDWADFRSLPSFDFMGPIAKLLFENHTLMVAYEHGSPASQRYLEFRKAGQELSLCAVKGNYYDGKPLDGDGHTTPWLHFGLCKEPLKEYRDFILKYISECTESRKPYIYYNTWNHQERIKAEGSETYHRDLNTARMLEEIDCAHEMGIDVFVIDCGWFSKTGDWEIDTRRFPDEMKDIRKKLDGYGMKLGLWFNPCVAAVSSEIYRKGEQYLRWNPEHPIEPFEVWETEKSGMMCLCSDYADWFADKLIRLHEELGVTYFKWDAIETFPECADPNHHHGTEENSVQERKDCFSFQLPLQLAKVAEKVSLATDGIVDFDVTEGGRCFGLAFLAAGKYFLMNNGPYYWEFDLPGHAYTSKTCNVFFYPGEARAKICRQFEKFDPYIPSVLFLTHFFPDRHNFSQQQSLASLVLGANGIWGDLPELSPEDRKLFCDTLTIYKKVAQSITESSPVIYGFPGSSPEIYEKIDPQKNEGVLCFFTNDAIHVTHLTQPLATDVPFEVIGDCAWELDGGHLKIQMDLQRNEARIVFLIRK